MMTQLLGAVLILVLVLWAGYRMRGWVLGQKFAVFLWRWFSGMPLHGKHITDAGWVRAGQKALTPTGHALRWWHLPRWQRAAWRTGGTLAAVGLVWAWFVNPLVTSGFVIFVVLVSIAAGVWVLWRLGRQRKHRRSWLHPLHLAAHQVAGIPRATAAGSWISVDASRTKAVLELPPGWPADDKDKQRLVAIASAKLGGPLAESPDVSWRLAGPKPQLELTAAQPPPSRVSLADIKPALDGARADELVWGLGRRSAVVSSSLSSDSPHLGLSMGSGAGKSVTARALLAQMLYRGCIGLILDYKMISHQWAAGLPNVAIARRPHEIHRALLWLGGEVERRNEVALAGADIDGNVHAVVGPRLIVVCEELNATVARLRSHWRDERGGDRELPQRSPALDALDAVSFMGRQVLTNVIYIGQRLSVKASGGDGDARENIGVVAFGRYSASNWKMLAGDHPMPPKSLTPGRIQVVGGSVRETQAVFMSAREARALATAGEVGMPPAGMPFVPRVAAETYAQIPGSDLPVVSKTGPVVPALPGRVTLSEAVGEGIVSCSLHAVRKASQRDPEFPGGVGVQGLAKLYDAVALAEWDAGRR